MGELMDATESAIGAATHLTSMDGGALEALRSLARKIDTDDDVRQAYLDWQSGQGIEGAKLRYLAMDNVSVPTYLKFCESLGLTPAGRVRLAEKKEPSGGKLAQLRAVDGQPTKRSARRIG